MCMPCKVKSTLLSNVNAYTCRCTFMCNDASNVELFMCIVAVLLGWF